MPQPLSRHTNLHHLARMNLLRSRWALAALAVLVSVAALLAVRALTPSDRPCVAHHFEGARFIVCRYDARRDELRLMSARADGGYLRSFDQLETALGADAARVRFAMNVGMFNTQGEPIGLFIAEGVEGKSLSLTDGPGNFHMKPNGVFWQGADGAVHVDTSEDYDAAAPAARWATQSGPMLVIDGELHERFAPDGESRLVRNGVGVRNARTAYFVISSGPVSFGRFARFFRDRLGCADALFLDGSVSSLWAPERQRRDAHMPIGPMVVVLER